MISFFFWVKNKKFSLWVSSHKRLVRSVETLCKKSEYVTWFNKSLCSFESVRCCCYSCFRWRVCHFLIIVKVKLVARSTCNQMAVFVELEIGNIWKTETINRQQKSKIKNSRISVGSFNIFWWIKIKTITVGKINSETVIEARRQLTIFVKKKERVKRKIKGVKLATTPIRNNWNVNRSKNNCFSCWIIRSERTAEKRKKRSNVCWVHWLIKKE